MIRLFMFVFGFFRFFFGAWIFYLVNRLFCPTPGEVSAARERNFWIESAGGAAFTGCGIFYGYGGCGLISARGLLMFLFLAVLMSAAFLDWETRLIYNRFPLMIFLLGIPAAALFPEYGLTDRMLGAAAVSGPMLFLAVLIPGAFGGGDIKLMAACGWFLGTGTVTCAAFLGLAAGAAYGLYMLAGKKLGRKDSFALGPFLAFGLAVSVFVKPEIVVEFLLT